MKKGSIASYFPCLEWGGAYGRDVLINDLLAAVIVTIMLIPQSLAYAMLAGLPPEAGLYASIVPILLYTVFGTSRTLAVGPVAVVSLMTATAVGTVVQNTGVDYATAALTLAGLSGVMLVAMGLFRLGFLANFLSHPVIAGFITASAIIIAASQLKHVMGVSAGGHNLFDLLISLGSQLGAINWITLVLGVVSTAFLFWCRKGLKALLLRLGLGAKMAEALARTGPVLAVVATTLLVWAFRLDTHGVSVVGVVPQSLPPLTWPSFSPELLKELLIPALLISVIGFVESISVAQTLAAKRRQRIRPDQELIGLGAANVGAALTGGFPVTGGFSRSVVNFDAGAETPAAGAMTAVMLAIAALMLTPLIHYLPNATLAATIIVAVFSLVDFGILKRSWSYSRADFTAVFITMAVTLAIGVEAGVSAGVLASVALFLYKTSRPHVAEVGLVPGTQHFRNINRHRVLTDPSLVTIRVDESLYFANARYLEDYIYDRIVSSENTRHLVLMCSAVNEIDMSALESLEAINHRLKDIDICMHLTEVKGPVMDRLQQSHFLDELTGQVFLSQYEAVQQLTPAVLTLDREEAAA